MKKIKLFVLFLMWFLILPVTVHAAGNVETDRSVIFRMEAVYGDLPVSNMEIHLYRISEMDINGELHVCSEYESYAEDLDIRGRNDSAWQMMAEVMYHDLLNTPHQPACVMNTDHSGIAVSDDLKQGLYLVTGKNTELNDSVYSLLPFFVMLPQQNTAENKWDYEVSVHAKMEQSPVLKDLTVNKVWNDKGNENRRPESVTVWLMMDGQQYGDSITLPYNGHWSYTWENLEAGHEWTVAEKPLEGYRSSVVRQGDTYILTNTLRPETPVTPQIPNTGQLWWPVPIMLCAGMICLIIGILKQRGSNA